MAPTLSVPGASSGNSAQPRSLTETRLTAIGLICVAVVLFALLDATAKYLTTIQHLPVIQVIWMRFASHSVLTLIVLGPKATAVAARSRKLANQTLRSLFLVGSTAFNFLALQFLQLDQTSTIFFLSPFVVAALAGPMLGEWVGWRRLLAICVGFAGVLFVTRPGFGGIHWAVSFSFVATLSYALYCLWTRYVARYDDARTTLFYTPLVGTLLLAPAAILNWRTPETLWIWLLLISTGFSGGLGHLLLIFAHERAPAPVLAPFGYVNIVCAIVIGYVVFSDIPRWWTMVGAAIIISSGIYLLFRERQKPGSTAPAASATVTEG